MSRLPKYMFIKLLVSGDTTMPETDRFTMKLLDLVDVDKMAVRRIFYMLSMTTNTSFVPMICRDDKTLCAEVYAGRLADVGMLNGWAKKFVHPVTGKIDWCKAGPYTFDWHADGYATHTYISLVLARLRYR